MIKNEKIFDKYMTWEKVTLCTKCPYSELFRSTFSRIWTEYIEIGISPYSVQMRENVDQNNFEYGHFFRSVSKIIKTNFNSELIYPKNV